ncbi:MAG: hypothetical protein AAFQ53_12440 [Bacteroidota bacterium]
MHWLVVTGAGLLVLLGVAHALLTLTSKREGGGMTPTDPRVQEAMGVVGGLGLAPDLQTTLWRAWVGFNLSHALGLVVSGLVIGLPPLLGSSVPLENAWWLVAALALPTTYSIVSARYWFQQPTTALSLATLLICAGLLGSWLAG